MLNSTHQKGKASDWVRTNWFNNTIDNTPQNLMSLALVTGWDQVSISDSTPGKWKTLTLEVTGWGPLDEDDKEESDEDDDESSTPGKWKMTGWGPLNEDDDSDSDSDEPKSKVTGWGQVTEDTTSNEDDACKTNSDSVPVQQLLQSKPCSMHDQTQFFPNSGNSNITSGSSGHSKSNMHQTINNDKFTEIDFNNNYTGATRYDGAHMSCVCVVDLSKKLQYRLS
ncbi:hypothetical protein C8R42DRAFT_711122 [Lentinula raphanica]|nr:hypothetical protein C8R42DRAFT_711122 [Lentinula raphanica]